MAADTCLDAGAGGPELEAPWAARPAPDSGIGRPRGQAPERPLRVPGQEAGGLAWREVSGRVEGVVGRPRGGLGGGPGPFVWCGRRARGRSPAAAQSEDPRGPRTPSWGGRAAFRAEPRCPHLPGPRADRAGARPAAQGTGPGSQWRGRGSAEAC